MREVINTTLGLFMAVLKVAAVLVITLVPTMVVAPLLLGNHNMALTVTYAAAAVGMACLSVHTKLSQIAINTSDRANKDVPEYDMTQPLIAAVLLAMTYLIISTFLSDAEMIRGIYPELARTL
ncbi:MAG: hypothetical protein K0U66_06350 [Gammaproteobacteria bacterium]|nr:hypothetical protein [Gammaproteobacteria bacterium]